MEPKEIFDLIVRADEALKYATQDKAQPRIHRAREFLARALEEARAIGNQPLIQQAEARLADLDALEHPPEAGSSG
jgi:hypothetical protein